MTSTVGIIGSGAGGVVFAPASTSSAPAQASAAFSTQLSSGTLPVSNVHNPRLINDPSAGIITEYLSANGSEVVSQTPSAVTVAYLRQGLTADGTPKSAVGKTA